MDLVAALLALSLLAVAAAELPRASSLGSPSSAPALPKAAQSHLQGAYAKLPLAFIPNKGQTDERVRYYAQGAGFSFYFTNHKAVFAFTKQKREQVLELGFLGANPSPKLVPQRPGQGTVNYLEGKDPSKWHRGLRTYGELRYRELWPGIDMVFKGARGKLSYEFALHPGARVSDIKLAYRGAKGLSLSSAGDLLIKTPLGVLSDRSPKSFERIGDRTAALESRFTLRRGTAAFGLAVIGHDRRRPLVIDPDLVYSTYLGGSGVDGTSGYDTGTGIAIDGAGSAYVTGYTQSSDFPTTVGAFQTGRKGNIDAFVTKLNAGGTALAYSTYLGGSGDQFSDGARAVGIAVDGAGSAYVTGQTDTSDFPTTAGALQTTMKGDGDAFVTKLSPDGSSLAYSTFLGGSDGDRPFGIAIDGAGSAYVAGGTGSDDFPVTAGAFQTSKNGQFTTDAFVAKLSPDGSALDYSTYLGGSAFEDNFGVGGIAVDRAGGAYVTGDTRSSDFPTTAGAFQTSLKGQTDPFVAKLNATGSALDYSTYLSGSGGCANNATDLSGGIAVDGAGSAYVHGDACSSDFPTTPGAFQTSFQGQGAGFVTKLNPSGTALAYSTFLGGAGGGAIAVDQAGRAYVTGAAGSDFPTTPGAFQTSSKGQTDAFVTKLNADGSALEYSSYLGGSSIDLGEGIAVDGAGNAYLTGETRSSEFPTSPGAFQPVLKPGPADAFVAKITPPPKRSDFKNAASFCKADRAFLGDEAFTQKYGGGANAYGKCVSQSH